MGCEGANREDISEGVWEHARRHHLLGQGEHRVSDLCRIGLSFLPWGFFGETERSQKNPMEETQGVQPSWSPGAEPWGRPGAAVEAAHCGSAPAHTQVCLALGLREERR